MTILVGLRCQEGVVIGSDSSATFTVAPTFNTIEQRVKKVFVIEDKVIVAGTGQVGFGQRFNAVIEKAWNDGAFKGTDNTPLEIAKRLCALGISDFPETSAPKGKYGALVAFPCGKKYCLCEFGTPDFQPELKDENIWCVAMGSGQPIADPFLGLLRRVFWKDSPPKLSEGIFAVAWTLQHAIELNPGGINGPAQIGTLSASRGGELVARLLDDAELAEHLDSVKGAEEYLARYPEILRGSAAAGEEIPSPPKG